MTFGAVILAGGRSRRMGQCKAELVLGGETLLARTVRQLADFSELWLSANDPKLAEGLPVRLAVDRYPGYDYYVLDDTGVPRLLAERFSPELDALVLADGGGRLHPLCGVYHRRALPAIRRQLEQGEWRVLDLLPHLRWARLSGVVPDRVLYNLNTPEDLLRLSNAADP